MARVGDASSVKRLKDASGDEIKTFKQVTESIAGKTNVVIQAVALIDKDGNFINMQNRDEEILKELKIINRQLVILTGEMTEDEEDGE